MLYLRADTITEVTVGPAVAVGDGFTPVTNLVGSSADEFELIKHGATTTTTIAGTLAAITGADGYYALDLSATDTNTEGRLVLLINDDSLILPIRHEFMVVNTNVYDSLFAAATTDYLQVDTIQLAGTTQDATDLADFAAAGYDPGTNKVQGVVLTDTTTTVTGGATSAALATAQADLDTITGADGVTLATAQGLYAPAKAGDSMALTAGAVDAIIDETLTSHVTADSLGVAIKDVLADTGELQANQGNWLTATGFATPTNITAGTITTVTNLTNAPTNGDLTAAMKASVNAEVDSALDTAIPGVPTADSINQRIRSMDLLTEASGAGDLAAILADTNELQGDDVPGLIAALNDVSTAEVLTQVNAALDTAIAELGVAAPTATPTLRTGLMLLYMALRNKTVVQTSGTDALEIYNDAGTKIASKLLTDDGSDYTEAEMT